MRGRGGLLAYLAISICLLYLLYVAKDAVNIIPEASWSQPVTTSLLRSQQNLWTSIYPQLLTAEPRCSPVPHVWGGDLLIGFDSSNKEVKRPDRLVLSKDQIVELKRSHEAFKLHLQNTDYALPFLNGTRGIATTAGGNYLPVAVVSIRMLRETGCTLPVEVFLATAEEWDAEICDLLLPSLHARCIVLDIIFNPPSARGTKVDIAKYQYKIMAIIFSSFEEVLFLDSDSFPTSDPSNLFLSTEFTATGMIKWPDFWFPSESPHYFEIANLEMTPIQERPGTESGQLMYHKPRHTKSLLMALYYNYYGPHAYYTLQAQGNAGEGDKETFLWSQVVFREAYYSVQQRIQALGYIAADGEWRGSAMSQFDPRDDNAYIGSLEGTDEGESKLHPIFVHVNFPKINPALIFQDQSFGVKGPTKDSDGRMRRIWFEDEQRATDYFGLDLERRLWSVVKDLACENEGKFKSWDGVSNICGNATLYWDTVFGNSSTS
jgi:alpha 1,2-mannosyltransferase